MGETDARVASGALDDGAAGLKKTTFLGILDDVQSSAVLDAATRVLELGLAQDVAACLFGKALEADEGSVSNGC